MNPNQAKVVTAVRRLQRLAQGAGFLVGQPADDAPPAVAARAQLRKRQAEGQRPRRQSDRDRRRRRLAHRRDGRGRVQRRRLRALRARADGSGGAHPGDDLPVRLARRRAAVAALVGRRDLAIGCATRSRSGWPRPASRSSRRASATWRTRRRSPARCCAASRRRRSSPRARRSSRARSAWSRWRSTQLSRKARRQARRGAQGGDGEQPAGGALQRTRREPVVNAGTLTSSAALPLGKARRDPP